MNEQNCQSKLVVSFDPKFFCFKEIEDMNHSVYFYDLKTSQKYIKHIIKICLDQIYKIQTIYTSISYPSYLSAITYLINY